MDPTKSDGYEQKRANERYLGNSWLALPPINSSCHRTGARQLRSADTESGESTVARVEGQRISHLGYTHVCLGFYHGFYLFIGACFSSGLYLQLLILKNGRGIMVNPPIIRGVDHLAPPTFPSSKFCNRPREPLMTSHNRPR